MVTCYYFDSLIISRFYILWWWWWWGVGGHCWAGLGHLPLHRPLPPLLHHRPQTGGTVMNPASTIATQLQFPDLGRTAGTRIELPLFQHRARASSKMWWAQPALPFLRYHPQTLWELWWSPHHRPGLVRTEKNTSYRTVWKTRRSLVTATVWFSCWTYTTRVQVSECDRVPTVLSLLKKKKTKRSPPLARSPKDLHN